MGRRMKAQRRRSAATRGAASTWESLTWNDLEDWAGSRSVSRGQAYQRQGRVHSLVLAEDGRLLATVAGGQRYVTSAWICAEARRGSKLESACTCPVGASGCKHAVAVVTDFLAALADGREVSAASPDDPRWARLLEDAGGLHDEFDDDLEVIDHHAAAIRPTSKQSQPLKSQGGRRRTRAEWDQRIQSYIQRQSRDELSALVGSLVERFPELRQEFQERITLGEGDVDRLVAAARRELRTVTAETGWRNSWTGEGHTPDFSRLKGRLARLVELGHADEVLKLGRELIARGMEQVGQSNDEGETGMALADCLTVVFDALTRSSLSAPERILFAIDACLEDEYDIVGDGANQVLDAEWSPADWSVVADKMAERLASARRGKGADDFMSDYRRDQISNWLLHALRGAGREGELSTIYEAEARATGSYQRLVDYLIDREQFEDAERWAREGIEKTHKQWPGIADGLAQSLCELARRRKQWDVVAAHAAQAFFDRPSGQSFKVLLAAAKKAGCQDPVRVATLRFLETGVPPISLSSKGKERSKATADRSWPLPVPDYLVPLMSGLPARSACQPYYDVLLDMAIADERPDDVLRWYETMKDAERRSSHGKTYWPCGWDPDRVAKAIATAYPERALEIHRQKLDAHLPQTGITAYETCAACLGQMRSIYTSLDQENYWDELLAEIRHKYHNRPRFMEILNKLEGRTILHSQKVSRRR